MLMIAWLHRRRGGKIYGKEKNEIMEENINNIVIGIYNGFNTCGKKFYNNIKTYNNF